ncbi:MAG: squalene/phytoene synthase family protein [Balneolaceae bacterium]
MTGLLKSAYHAVRPWYEMTSIHRSVIDEVEDERMQRAYEHCRQVTRTYAKTFYLATRFLPNEKQRGIFSIYAICRYLDDLVDESEDLIEKRQLRVSDVQERLDRFREDLLAHYTGTMDSEPVLTAFAQTLRHWQIPVRLPLELMEGVRMDLTIDRYETFQELYQYAYRVASTVGLMTSEVFGYTQEEALEYAEDLGIAMQLTNILRDVGEDLRRNRIYLPADELELFGIREDQLFDAQTDSNFEQFMRFQITRARRYYSQADLGIPMLSADSRMPVWLARENYSSILRKIEENRYQVFNQRAYLNTVEKVRILPKIYFRSMTSGSPADSTSR